MNSTSLRSAVFVIPVEAGIQCPPVAAASRGDRLGITEVD